MNSNTEEILVRFRSFLAGAGVFLSPLGIVFAQTPASLSPEKSDVEQLTKFEVTGSRIKGIDLQSALPVVRYTTDSLNLAGSANIGDALRNLSFNSGGSIDPQRTGTFASGARTLNLRGLGSRNTLILINGRRIAGYGLAGGNGFDSVIDLNSAIPDSAIAEIDVLKDGASAIYGSDAVAGVVNIITKKDFNGLNVVTKFGNTTEKDAFERYGAITFGNTSGKTQVIGTATWTQANSIKLQDRSFSRTADLTYFGGANSKSGSSFPGRVSVPKSVAGMTGTGNIIVTFPSPTTTPLVSNVVPYTSLVNGYDFNPATDLYPPYRTYGMFVSAHHEISDTLYFLTELAFVKNNSSVVAAAPPVVGSAENGTSPAGHLIFPATNPYNPFGVDISDSNLNFRLVEIGGRTNEIDVDSPRLLVGLGGTIATKWDWEATATYSSNTVNVVNTNQALDRQVQAALSGVKGPKTARMLYLNPFGPNDPELIEYLRANFNRSAKAEAKLYEAHLGGPLFDLPWGGNVKGSIGGEIRQEKIASTRSADEQSGQIIGGSEGFSTYGQRSVKSLYAETSVPIIKGLNMQLAARFEDYSDFGKTTKPKLALGYRPTDWFLIRGSFSKAFKAPDLAQLYNGGTVSFSSESRTDDRRPSDPAAQVRIVTIGNSKLKPEETDVYYGGVVFEPQKGKFLGFLDGFSASFDYFTFNGKNVITNFGYKTILFNETVSSLFGNLVIRGTPPPGETVGQLISVDDSFLNASTQKWKGFDLEVKYDFDTSRFGRFAFQSEWTYTESIQFDGIEFVHSFTYPRLKGTSRLRWANKDWEVGSYAFYKSDYNDSSVATSNGNGLLNKIQSSWFFNPYVQFAGLKPFTFRLGVDNVFNKNPPRSYRETTGYDNLTYSGQGRFVYFQASIDL